MSILGASLIGGGLGLIGSSGASKRSARATRDAIGETRRQYDTTRGDLMPWMGAGQNALSAYQAALGLGPVGGGSAGGWSGGGSGGAPMSYEAWQAANPAKPTGKTRTEQYTDERGELHQRRVPIMSGGTQAEYNTYLKGFHTGQPASGGYKPANPPAMDPTMNNGVFAPAGRNPLAVAKGEGYINQLREKVAPAGQGAAPESVTPSQRFEFKMEEDPGYQFAREQAMKEVERAMAARGYNRSGNLLNALADRSTGLASLHAGDIFNRQLATSNTNYGRDLTESQTLYGRDQDYLNRLANLSGGGQNAAAQLGGFGANAAGTIGSLGVQGAANQGNFGMMGAGIANNAIQGYFQNSLLNKYLNPPGGGVPPTWQGWQ